MLLVCCRPESVGELVVSRFTGDTDWYRAEVQALHPDSALVLYIDYRNSDTIPFTMLRKAESFCMDVPSQGIPCTLNNIVAPDTGDWPPAVASIMAELAQTPLKGLVKQIQDNVASVELFTLQDVSVNEMINTLLLKTTPSKSTGGQAEADAVEIGKKVVPVHVNEMGEAPATPPTVTLPVIEERTLPTDGTQVSSLIVYIESLASFFIQTNSEEFQKELLAIQTGVNQVVGDDMTVHTPVVDEYVAARYTEADFTMWYRAKVLAIADNKVQVFIIDYGNTDWISAEEIRKLDPIFFELPSLAVRCKLNGATGDEDEDLKADFGVVKNEVVNVKVLSTLVDRYVVDLSFPKAANVTISSVLGLIVDDTSDTNAPPKEEEQNVRNETEETKSPIAAAPREPETEQLYTGIVMKGFRDIESVPLQLDTLVSAAMFWVENIYSFYVQLADEQLQLKFHEIMSEFTKVFESAPEYKADVGEIVGAYYFDGDQALWYRGKVLALQDNKCQLLFFDYGNTDFVEMKNIRAIEERFLCHPAMAIKCGLTGQEQQTDTMLQELMKLLTIEVKIKAVACKDGIYEVEMLTLDGVDVNEQLGLKSKDTSLMPQTQTTDIKDHLPKASPPGNPLPQVRAPPRREKQSYFTQTLTRSRPETKDLQVVITAIVRPNLFHCQVFTTDQQSKYNI